MFVWINILVSLLVWVHASVVTHSNMEMNFVLWLPCLTHLLLNCSLWRKQKNPVDLSLDNQDLRNLISTCLGLNFFYALKMLSQIIRLKGFYSAKWKVYAIAGLLIRVRLSLWKQKKILLFSLSPPEQDLKTNYLWCSTYFVLQV